VYLDISEVGPSRQELDNSSIAVTSVSRGCGALTIARLRDVVEVIRDVAQIAAILLGGIWAYLKFIRGRTFKSRGELRVKATLLTFDDEPAILIDTRFQNTGLSRIKLRTDIAHVTVDWLPSSRWSPTSAANWAPMRSATSDAAAAPAYPIFQDHESVEPGETITGQILVILAENAQDADDGLPLFYRARALISNDRTLAGRIAWTAEDTIPTKFVLGEPPKVGEREDRDATV
jgi:hypothetical protein